MKVLQVTGNGHGHVRAEIRVVEIVAEKTYRSVNTGIRVSQFAVEKTCRSLNPDPVDGNDNFASRHLKYPNKSNRADSMWIPAIQKL